MFVDLTLLIRAAHGIPTFTLFLLGFPLLGYGRYTPMPTILTDHSRTTTACKTMPPILIEVLSKKGNSGSTQAFYVYPSSLNLDRMPPMLKTFWEYFYQDRGHGTVQCEERQNGNIKPKYQNTCFSCCYVSRIHSWLILLVKFLLVKIPWMVFWHS